MTHEMSPGVSNQNSYGGGYQNYGGQGMNMQMGNVNMNAGMNAGPQGANAKINF